MSSLIRIELPLGQLGRLTGQTETLPPIDGERSQAGRSLDVPQVAAEIGSPVPIVFCRWRSDLPEGQRGGVMIAPPATDGAFGNDSLGAVTARYQLLLSEGRLGGVQVRDVFQAGNRVGALTQAYDRRAGNWGPAYGMVPWGSNPAPGAPAFVGSGQGRYDDVTMGAFSVTCPANDQSWTKQVHLFIRQGMEVDRLIEQARGPSDNLADLVVWALLSSGRVSAQLVDGAAMLAAAEFLDANDLRLNCVIRERSGLLDWLTEVLPYYLLRLVRSRGIYRLRPLLPTVAGGDLNLGRIEWSRTFTVADIDVSSLRLRTIPSGDRRPIALLVQWRQQLEDSEAFVRTTTVRFGGSAMSGPFEQVNLSTYSTSARHAVVYGAFRLALRRYVEHRLTFRLRPSADSETMVEGDIVRVILTATNEDVGDVRIDQLYSVEQISRSPAGVATLELLHFPVDDQGRSLLALDVAAAQALPVDLPLFTGRGDPGLDSNDPTDTTVPPDQGPWPQWRPPAPPEPLYPGGDDWPPDVEIPDFPPIGNDPVPPISGLNPNPVPPTPIPPPGDGWGAGRTPAQDIGDLPIDPGYVAAVSFDQVRLTYPYMFYDINQPNAVGLTARVTVDNPPVDRAMRLVIGDGVGAWAVTIPVGKTSALLPTDASTRTDTLEDDADRSLKLLGYSGGGYYAPKPAEGEPKADPVTATETGFTVKNYEANITLRGPGLWEQNGDGGWVLQGGDPMFLTPAGWTWNTATEGWERTRDSGNWLWDAVAQRWTQAADDPSDWWEWNEIEQRWDYSLTYGPPPPASAGVAPPPPLVPDFPPAGNGFVWLTLPPPTAYGWVWKGDDSNLPKDWAAIHKGWKWSFKDQEWQYNGGTGYKELIDRGTPGYLYKGAAVDFWTWDVIDQKWVFDEDSAPEKWRYTGPTVPCWRWDRAQQFWDYRPGGSCKVDEDGTTPPANPPAFNGEGTPPSAAGWEWVRSSAAQSSPPAGPTGGSKDWVLEDPNDPLTVRPQNPPAYDGQSLAPDAGPYWSWLEQEVGSESAGWFYIGNDLNCWLWVFAQQRWDYSTSYGFCTFDEDAGPLPPSPPDLPAGWEIVDPGPWNYTKFVPWWRWDVATQSWMFDPTRIPDEDDTDIPSGPPSVPRSVPEWEWKVEDQQWQWNNPSGIQGWVWNPEDARWEISGTFDGWLWSTVEQRWLRTVSQSDQWRYGASGWIYTGATVPTPEPPAAIGEQPDGPPATPLPVPADDFIYPPGSYVVTVTATLERPAVGEDMVLQLSDYVGEKGGQPPYSDVVDVEAPLVIPAVAMNLGLWRWVPAAQWWQHPGDVNWAWDPASREWIYLRSNQGEWTWNTNRDRWEGGIGEPPPVPPQAFGTAWPPDAERWSYSGSWAAPAINQTTPGGTAPVFNHLTLSRDHTYGVLL